MPPLNLPATVILTLLLGKFADGRLRKTLTDTRPDLGTPDKFILLNCNALMRENWSVSVFSDMKLRLSVNTSEVSAGKSKSMIRVNGFEAPP